MDEIVGLLILLLIIILVAPLLIAASTRSKINQILRELDTIKKQLKQVHEPNNAYHKTNQTQEKTIPIETKPITTYRPPQFDKPIVEEKIVEPEKIIPNPTPIVEPEIAYTIPKKTIEPIKAAYKTPTWKKNMEQFIAEKLISIVGIIILVLGIVFTVKWAIHRNLIGDAGKVAIGLLSGTILIAVAHKLSKNFRAFSSILAGGGVAVLYFSIYQSYQGYHLINQTMAFGIMIVITLLSVLLSLFYDKKELAIISIIGGFATPFLVSNGSGNYKVLFTYLLILNAGMFLLAIYKKWKIVNLISYLLTVIIFGAWMMQYFSFEKAHAWPALLFASGFYLLFLSTNLIYPLKHQERFGSLEIGMLLSNTLFYFGSGLYILHGIHDGIYQGVFTMALALLHFLLIRVSFRKQFKDIHLSYLLLGLVLTFVSLTAPIQLDGNYITLFWACEMVILYFIGMRSDMKILKTANILVLILTIGSLVMDWEQNYYHVHISQYNWFFNKAFITGLIVMAALFFTRKLVKLDNDTTLAWGNITVTFYKSFVEIILMLVIYFSFLLELDYQCQQSFGMTSFVWVVKWLYQYVFAACLYFYSQQKKTNLHSKIMSFVVCGLLLLYPIANAAIANFRNQVLLEGIHSSLIPVHYFIPLMAIVNTILLIRFIKLQPKDSSWFKNAYWFVVAILLFVLSSESNHLWVLHFYEKGFSISNLATKASKIVWPILWSLSSLFLMILGMQQRIKLFRIISLSLFTLTIVKLFVFDMNQVSQGGRIAAFMILGIILLVVAFMYQKVKGLFQDENNVQPS